MTDEELRRLFDSLRQDNAALREETSGIRREIAESHTETRRLFEVTAERLEKKFDTLAEAFVAFDEKVERRFGAGEDSIERTSADTQAMIKFSTQSWIAVSARSKSPFPISSPESGDWNRPRTEESHGGTEPPW